LPDKPWEEEMAEAVRDLQKEFWRPPDQTVPRPGKPEVASLGAIACPGCGTEYVVGARFCHACGGGRGSTRRRLWPQVLDPHRIREALGLSTGPLVAWLVGMACVVAAPVTGLIYSANTMADWQAIQVWRIEWLLAASAAFLAGILLKKARA
jgi:hypothetical protein